MAAMVSSDRSLLEARIDDLVSIAENKNYAKFSVFFNESEAFFANKYLQKRGIHRYLFYGGCQSNTRTMLGIFPDYMEPAIEMFPIVCLKLSYPKQYHLGHRDFLGSLMGLQLKRDAIGDILPMEGGCFLFVRDSVSEFIIQNLCQVGRVGVRVSIAEQPPDSIEPEFREISGTVSSMRLDAVVALLCRISREKAVQMLQSGQIQLNYTDALSKHTEVKPNDILTVRGYGKFIVTENIISTKKGRLHVTINQYI